MTQDQQARITALQQTLRGKRGQLLAKRVFDLVVCVMALAVIWPVLLLIALAIVLDDRGPVLYRQTRVGRNGRHFSICKFRTMIVDADTKGLLTVGADARITRVGHFLRRTKLDELAQLLNIVTGDMSLVGPRPEVPRYVAMYDPLQRMVLSIRPGLTDAASIRYRDENALLGHSSDPERTYIEEVMPAKLAINLDYLRSFTVWGDILLLFSTVTHVGGDALKGK